MYNFLLIILALIIPPLAVFMKSGLNFNFFFNIAIYTVGVLLSVFTDFSFGALIAAFHAIWIICTTD